MLTRPLMLRSRRVGVAAIVLVLLMRCAGGTDTSTTSASDCRRIDLDPRPTWAFYGAWTGKGEELVLPDVLQGRLLRLNRAGAQQVSTGDPASPFHWNTPLEIWATDAALFLRDGTDRLLVLGDDFNPKSELQLREMLRPTGDYIGHVASLTEADGRLIGLVALVDHAARELWWGFGRLTLADPPGLERLRTLPSLRTLEGDLYFSHEGPFLARAGDGTYALLFEDDPHIERLLPEPGRLATFPTGYRSPKLPKTTGPSTTEQWYQAWETAAAPVGLFGRGDFLFVLARRPREDGTTEWTLYQIDPARDEMIRAIELPTRANHLILVPGPKDWAIVEKGPVSATPRAPNQAIGPVVLIPAPWIENPRSGVDLSKCNSSATAR